MVKHFFPLFFIGGFIASIEAFSPARAATPATTPTPENVRYVGAVTCESSMCHGGASPSRDQFTIWSHEDFHSRAYATLVTARSTQIAETLGLGAAAESNRCTTCHAPFAGFPKGELASTVTVTEGVSCEICHNGADSWLRGHTRPDWTYGDRVHAGMRDLRSAFIQANTCVACHQVIDPELVKAGHPELTFELDGQSASEPRHWKEKDIWFGPKAWLVGQTVALSRISAQLTENNTPDLAAQQKALVWLLQQVPAANAAALPADRLAATAAWSNQQAQDISARDWTRAMTADSLAALAGTSGSFADKQVPAAEQEQRAERLVLGLDRLFKALHVEKAPAGQAELVDLFAAVQDRDKFDSGAFSKLVQKFADAVVKTP